MRGGHRVPVFGIEIKATHLEDDTVGGDTITRLELDQVADHDLLGVHVSQLAACRSKRAGNGVCELMGVIGGTTLTMTE